MDKLRMKDSQYYRGLLLKNEFKLSSISREMRDLQRNQNAFQNVYVTDQKENIKYNQKNLLYIKLAIIMQIALFCQNIDTVNTFNSVKELVSFITNYDYSSAMFYMWENYGKQVPTIPRFSTIWENFM
jgi:hypothetical protein